MYWIDPLRDTRWASFVQKHTLSSIFHSTAWLDALHRTYGYIPAVVTSASPGEELSNGIVFCRISSWLTGRRLVSLPFSDHCEPLGHDVAELLKCISDRDRGKYAEIRPLTLDNFIAGWFPSETFCFHRLDLRPSVDELYSAFHKDCVQRKIRRAEREGLTYESGRSEPLLAKFYRLQIQTRRRQKLPPQPLAWFRNLMHCLGEALTIRVASKDGVPVASILTLSHKTTLTYKYGSSDARYNSSGGTQLLFWKAIQEAKAEGMLEFDLGRSECENDGLITFKDRWGATRSTLTYSRTLKYSAATADSSSGRNAYFARQLFSFMPDWLFVAVGRVLYPHVG